jgi:uncharacterized membrane protein
MLSTQCMLLFLALLIGIVAGLRALTPLALVSWATRLGWLKLEGTRLAFLGYAFMPWLLTVLALFELIVVDQSPTTPSRKAPMPFAARIVSGLVCGGAVGAHGGMLIAGAATGAVGAVAGTLGGAAVRERLAQRLGKDRPAALLEDLVAIALAVLVAIAFA